jgi:hypothetical protein
LFYEILALTWIYLKVNFIVFRRCTFHGVLIEEKLLFQSAPGQNISRNAQIFTQYEIQFVSSDPEDAEFLAQLGERG